MATRCRVFQTDGGGAWNVTRPTHVTRAGWPLCGRSTVKTLGRAQCCLDPPVLLATVPLRHRWRHKARYRHRIPQWRHWASPTLTANTLGTGSVSFGMLIWLLKNCLTLAFLVVKPLSWAPSALDGLKQTKHECAKTWIPNVNVLFVINHVLVRDFCSVPVLLVVANF